MWSTSLPGRPHARHVCSSRFKMRARVAAQPFGLVCRLPHRVELSHRVVWAWQLRVPPGTSTRQSLAEQYLGARTF